MRDQIIIALTICLEKTEEIKTSVNINKLQVYDIINNNAEIKAVIINSANKTPNIILKSLTMNEYL